MKLKNLFLTLAVLAAFVSCKSQYEILLTSNDVQTKYAAAFDYFNQGKYVKSTPLFESLSVLTEGTARHDTVLYYWGLSNYMYRDFYTAETNFDKYIEHYPSGTFASDARFLRIECLYRSTLRYELDQTPTYKAINAISEYVLEYPDNDHMQECKDMLMNLNDRLDLKAYESARLYYKMEDYLASGVALRNVLKDDSENIYREDILYHIAMSSYKYASLSVPEKRKERYLIFVDDYYNIIGEMPDTRYRRELDNIYNRVQRALGKNVADHSDREMTEKDFAKERRKVVREERKSKKN
ncbi:MAG: outer membrane protein assembly factor BamD [Bacteroidales bacterium]|nr:outer membrane protein assembly factor BamD [Bacteroidales bacterium]